ncbi:hypothetical protein GGH12_002873 [Coemansia sp. RSA 1822]|nr:hypothetical protein LPJ76_001759 [Coemansia sp. RSA 638]KAJ2124244.1 hypothetical protein IW147_001983 [Coemansia sp. RSA 720]KAJ2562998.1 hypothetical protein GGH12_002873 [Coemansia sp. RSA 1822]
MPLCSAAHVLGNHNSELHFDMQSGVLIAQVILEGCVVMPLPANVQEPVAANAKFNLLTWIVRGKHWETMDIVLSPALRYLIVHGSAEDSSGRLQVWNHG